MEQDLASTGHIEKYVALSRKQSIICRQMVALNKIEEFLGDREFNNEYRKIVELEPALYYVSDGYKHLENIDEVRIYFLSRLVDYELAKFSLNPELDPKKKGEMLTEYFSKAVDSFITRKKRSSYKLDEIRGAKVAVDLTLFKNENIEIQPNFIGTTGLMVDDRYLVEKYKRKCKNRMRC